MPFNPVELAKETERLVVRGDLRRYYRVARPGKWYGGIATSDCCGCNLRCVFCWSGAPRDRPGEIGDFYSPAQIFDSLTGCARRVGYRQLRVSGNEPTLGSTHMLGLLELVDRTEYQFILETNGIMFGHEPAYAARLSEFGRVHVRVSLKGTNSQEFSRLTGATPQGFELQLDALRNLTNAGVPCHAAVMLSFSSEQGFQGLLERLRDIHHGLAEDVEKEYVFLYPGVVGRLRAAGIEPTVAYKASRIPRELV